jgi:putative colanic acid biosynthesis UDP-glucose lipid carrier transferase
MPKFEKGFIRTYHSKLDIAHRLIDAAIILSSLLISSHFFGFPWNPHFSFYMVTAILLFYLFASRASLYYSFRISSQWDENQKIFKCWALTMFIILSIAFLQKMTGEHIRKVIILWFVNVQVGLVIWRVIVRTILRYARKKGRNTKTYAIGGAGDLGVKLYRIISRNIWMGLLFDGFYDDFKPKCEAMFNDDGMKIKGTLDDMVGKAKMGMIDTIYIVLPMRAEARIKDITTKLADTTASLHIVPDLFAFTLLTARVIFMEGLPVFSIHETPFRGPNDWLKRAEDIILGLLISILIMPLFLIIGFAVKLSSPGPIIFRQRRYGMNGEEIWVWKFRSMTVCEDGPNIPQAQKNDVRVTRFGAFLRKSSLDELPQFINVLKGDMSIVGPRPHAVAHNEYYRQLVSGYMLRHKVKPGITGWAQVNGWRGETDTLDKMKNRVEYDLAYIRNWSLWLDLKIIFMTVVGSFCGKNAY